MKKSQDSFYSVKKVGQGELYRNCVGKEITFLYGVCKCEKPKDCKICHMQESRKDIASGRITVILGDGVLHEFIEKSLLSGDLTRGTSMNFWVSSKDAFADIGVKGMIEPNESICCYLEEPAI